MRIGSFTRFVARMSVLTTMAPAIAQAPLVTEETMVDSPQAGQKLYVRNKHAKGMTAFTPERTVVFVHGATYPTSTAFDLPGYGRTALPAGGRLAGPAILL